MLVLITACNNAAPKVATFDIILLMVLGTLFLKVELFLPTHPDKCNIGILPDH